jgi:hypothetical protein
MEDNIQRRRKRHRMMVIVIKVIKGYIVNINVNYQELLSIE